MAKKKSSSKGKSKNDSTPKATEDRNSAIDDIVPATNKEQSRSENGKESDNESDGSSTVEAILDADTLLKSMEQLKMLDPDGFNSIVSRYIEPGDIEDDSRLAERNKDLREKNESLKNMVENAERNLSQLSSLQEEKEKKFQALGDENHNLSKEIQAYKEQIKSLEEVKSPQTVGGSSDDSEITHLKEALAASEAAKEEAEEQYQSLVGKLSHIKSTLGERLKSDSEELASYRVTVRNLEATNKSLEETIETLQREVITATKDGDKLSIELSSLRSEFQDSLLKWEKEKNNLIKDQRRTEHELSEARSSVRDLEIALSDGKSLNEGVHSKISELQDQVSSQTDYAERFRSERDSLKLALSKLEENLQSKQLEFSEKLAVLYSEAHDCQERLDSKEKELRTHIAKVEELTGSSEKVPQLEKEVRDKNLQIGKLRHEAVILNEHLTKALRLIKKDSEGETVDKQLITNLIVSFVTIPRGDTKKFEVLQLIANFLRWDEDVRVQAGLSRGANGTRTPGIGSPRKSFSSTSLADENGASGGGFMGLFAEFLERESTTQ
jgi:chromosome segregation ATPase